MRSRVKGFVSWLLIAFLAASVVTGCGGESLPEKGQQDRSVSVRQMQETSLQEEAQEERQGSPPGEAQGERRERSAGELPGEALQESASEPSREGPGQIEAKESGVPLVEEDGAYTSKEEVAAYIHRYGHLPDNYITKREAEELGWDSRKGDLAEVAPGKSIGGSRFGNYEGLLPEKEGRRYYECDIGYEGGHRGAKRLVYSDDGLIFYTEDHYKTFEQMYERQGDGS